MSGESGLTKRQLRQAFKADCLHILSGEAEGWDYPTDDDRRGLTDDEMAEVFQEIGMQLYRWAVRLTPLGNRFVDEPGKEGA